MPVGAPQGAGRDASRPGPGRKPCHLRPGDPGRAPCRRAIPLDFRGGEEEEADGMRAIPGPAHETGDDLSFPIPTKEGLLRRPRPSLDALATPLHISLRHHIARALADLAQDPPD